jgi:hypothetical protein
MSGYVDAFADVITVNRGYYPVYNGSGVAHIRGLT